MKKNFKVIQLNGFAGLIIILLVVLAAIGSIVVLPIYGTKFLWNEFVSSAFTIQEIRLSQAALLWFAALAVFYGYLKKRICFKFVNSAEMPNNINSIDYEKFMEKIKEEQQKDEKINH